MISVIVPVYRVEKYLCKCVKSIQSQTYTDLEIILVDDGSPDNCGKICDELASEDKRIKVIHQKNGGQAKARNAGLDIAKGKYITFVDSDDTIEPQMIEILLVMLKKNVNADISICGYRSVYEGKSIEFTGDVQLMGDVALSKQKLWQEVFGKLNNAVWNKMYDATLIGSLRFPEGIIHGEDLIFNLEYLKKCQGGVINQTPLYNYLQRKGSVTGSEFTANNIYEIKSKDIALKIVEKYAPDQLLTAKKYCFRARMNVLRAIYKSGKEKTYAQDVTSCMKYVKESYLSVKSVLKMKEKIEYWLFVWNRPAYKMIISKM